MKELLFFTAEKLPLIQITDLFLGVRSNLSKVLLILNGMFYTTDILAPHLSAFTPLFKDQIKKIQLDFQMQEDFSFL